jgi:hypothetical protein
MVRAIISASLHLEVSYRIFSTQEVRESRHLCSRAHLRYYLLLLLNVFFVFLFASSYWVLVSDAPMRVSPTPWAAGQS